MQVEPDPYDPPNSRVRSKLPYHSVRPTHPSPAMSPVPTRLVPWPEHKSLDKQAIPVPGTKRPGQSRKCPFQSLEYSLTRFTQRTIEMVFLPLYLSNYLLITWNSNLGTNR